MSVVWPDSLPVVILAAGRGNRLGGGNGSLPKPMTRLLGLSLLERAVLASRDAGARQFRIVVGYEKERVARHAEEIGRRYRVEMIVVENPYWENGNGTSALVVRPLVQGPFLLLMADHVVDPRLITTLIAADGGSSCLLGVDQRTQTVFDIEDATKVSLQGELVADIGKELSSFDAVDTGVFLCRAPVFIALERALRRGDGSLSGGMRELARQGELRAVPIGSHSWIDIDTPAALKAARDLLLTNSSKSQGDGPVARFLNRPISRRISALLAPTPLGPNVLTLLSFAIVLLASISFVQGHYPWFVLGGLLTQLGSILDGCDGEIARIKFQSSQFGAWLDTVADRYADVTLIAGIALGRWGDYPDQLIILGSLVATAGFIMFSYARKEHFLRFAQEPPMRPGYRLVPASRDIRLLVVAIGALLGLPFLAVLFAGLMANASVFLGLLIARRR